MNPDPTGRVAREDRRVWPFLHALGRRALPDRVDVAGRTLHAAQFVKHDFFAATGFYDDMRTGERVVVKIARTEPILGLPTRWLGRLICRRELKFYDRLRDLPNVPPVLGRVGDTGFAHAYVAGRPLEKGRPVPDGFFDDLLALIDGIAARGINVVDTHKPENILLGNDGRPHLIDFQISFDRHALGGVWPAGAVFRIFHRTDRYHVLKHKVRCRPDLATAEDRAAVERRNWAVRLHRRLARPYFAVRRRLFARLRSKGRLMPEGSK